LDLSTFFVPKKPINIHAQYVREGLKFVVEDMAVTVFDFGNCGSVELNPKLGEPPRKGVLRQGWLRIMTRLSDPPTDNVFPRSLPDHT
jgi:hypothetical protein